jgi:hypothetical protein
VGKGWGEVGVSKIGTEVDVKIACPLGRRKGEMPTREWEREESGKKQQGMGETLKGIVSSPPSDMRGPLTDKRERSGKVKGTCGSLFRGEEGV